MDGGEILKCKKRSKKECNDLMKLEISQELCENLDKTIGMIDGVIGGKKDIHVK